MVWRYDQVTHLNNTAGAGGRPLAAFLGSAQRDRSVEEAALRAGASTRPLYSSTCAVFISLDPLRITRKGAYINPKDGRHFAAQPKPF
jgi:hypothetical protein